MPKTSFPGSGLPLKSRPQHTQRRRMFHAIGTVYSVPSDP